MFGCLLFNYSRGRRHRSSRSETSKKRISIRKRKEGTRAGRKRHVISWWRQTGQHVPVVLSVYGTTPSRRRLAERPENAASLLMCACYDPHRCWRAGAVPKSRMEKVDWSLARAILFSLNSVATRTFVRRIIYPILLLLPHVEIVNVVPMAVRHIQQRAFFLCLLRQQKCLGGRDSHYIRPDHAQSPSLAGDQRAATRCSKNRDGRWRGQELAYRPLARLCPLRSKSHARHRFSSHTMVYHDSVV